MVSWQCARCALGAVLPALTKLSASGVNEGNPKWAALPLDELSLGEAVRQVPEALRLYNADCTLLPINLYLTDHKASTLETGSAGGRGLSGRT
ncbi:hypothetical protein P4133_01780 [Pseudomonas aeruginosa]|nr:hypothetical protein [Pseudomonas aeruginosa]